MKKAMKKSSKDNPWNFPENQNPDRILGEPNPNVKVWADSEGNYHRDGDLPSEVFVDGRTNYRCHGQLHRDGDKPSHIVPGWAVSYHRFGVLHREDIKPAVITLNGRVCYYKHGRHIKSEYNSYVLLLGKFLSLPAGLEKDSIAVILDMMAQLGVETYGLEDFIQAVSSSTLHRCGHARDASTLHAGADAR